MYITGERGRLWEGHIVEKGIYSGREGYILGASHKVVEKGGIFWEAEVDSGSVAYRYLKGWYILGGIDSGKVTL